MSKPITQDLFAFTGVRRNRKSYILFLLSSYLTAFIAVFATFGAIASANAWVSATASVLLMALAVAIFVAQFATATQRFRDFDRTGWWALLLLIPYVGFITVICLAVIPGTEGTNNYGPDPLLKSI